jgi:hypothetical protein
MVKLKGSIEIRVIDVDSGDVVDVIKQGNVITDRALYYRIMTGNSMGNTTNSIVLGLDTSIPQAHDWSSLANTVSGGAVPSGVSSPQWFSATPTTPQYAQWVNRINPGASTRTINYIALIDTLGTDSTYTGQQPVNAYVALTTPCTQTSTQILDVYYRVQFIPPATGTTNMPLSSFNQIAYYSTVGNTQYVPGTNMLYYWLNTQNMLYYNILSGPPYNYYLNNNSMGSGNLNSSNSANVTTTDSIDPWFKRTLGWNMSTTQMVGRIIGTVAISSPTYHTNNWQNFGWQSITAPTKSKIQPISSHASSTLSATTAQPFLDSVSSSGTGYLVANENWTRPDYPELYRINITNSGAVGTSTYQFQKRNHVGFNGNTYGNVIEILPFMVDDGTQQAIPGGHGTTNNANTSLLGTDPLGFRAERIDYSHIVTYDRTGVTTIGLGNGLYKNFDSTTIPALPVTYIQQVAVGTDKSLWVACANTGLYNISADGTTVTQIGSIAGVTSTNCYAVDIGRTGSIWAVFKGGLAQSTDNGVSWTVFNSSTSPAFNFVGVSDNNWDSVGYMRADPSNAGDNMCLVRKYGTTVLQTTGFVWWSKSTGTATAGRYSGTVGQKYTRIDPSWFNVSDNTGLWLALESSSANSYVYNNPSMPYVYTFGSTAGSILYAPSYAYQPYGLPGIAFEVDSQGNDGYWVFEALSSTPPAKVSLIRSTGVVDKVVNPVMTDPNGNNVINNFSSGVARAVYLGNGAFTWTVYGYYGTNNNFTVGISQNSVSATSWASSTGWTAGSAVLQCLWFPALDNTAQGGPFSSLYWTNYGWNGSSWVVNNSGSKPTHSTYDPLLNGVNLSFVDGSSGTSFVSGDYYNMGVTDGIWKDNTVTTSGSMVYYLNPTKFGVTDFTPNTVSTFPYTTGTVTWKKTHSQLTVNADNSLINTYPQRAYALSAISNNKVFGDFQVDFHMSPDSNSREIWLSLQSNLNTYVNQGVYNANFWTPTAVDYGWWFNKNIPGTIDSSQVVYSPTYTAPTIPAANTTYSIKRVGTVISYLINGTVVKTSAVSSTQLAFGIQVFYGNYSSVNPTGYQYTVPAITISSSGTGYYVAMGSSTNDTGTFDPNFNAVEGAPISQISINGTPATNLYNLTAHVPVQGEVDISSEDGVALFNAADLGKTITGSYTYINKPS